MRPREVSHIKFFIDWLNKKESLDFKIDETFRNEDSPFDIIIKSSKRDITLRIQNVAYRAGTFHKSGQSNIPNFKPVLVIGRAMSKEERRDSLIKCIESKSKKYPESTVKNIVLVIEVSIPSIKPEEIEELLPKDKEFGFKGIYFVQLPVIMASADDKYGQTGYVYPFKPCSF